MANYTIAINGDSLSDPAGYAGSDMPEDTWCYRLWQRIQAAYPLSKVTIRNFAVSGATTGQMVARMGAMIQYDIPRIAFLYGGANDPFLSSTVKGSGATTTVIPVQTGAGVNYGVGSWVLISGASAQIKSISGDNLTLVSALGSAPADTTPVTIDTRKNLVQCGKFMVAAGCSRLAIHGMHMKNWTAPANGDTLVAEETTYGALRVLQQGAVADLVALGINAVYVNNLAAMRKLITDGVETLYSNCWALWPDNQHGNCARRRAAQEANAGIPLTGRGGYHDVMADNSFAALQAQSGWLV